MNIRNTLAPSGVIRRCVDSINKSSAVLLGAAAIAAAVALAPAAHADSDDTAFLRAIHGDGITDDGGDQDLIKLGHSVCTLLGAGYTTNALVAMGSLHATRVSRDDERVLVQSAEAAYCPEYIQ
jgi:hypothetical protein